MKRTNTIIAILMAAICGLCVSCKQDEITTPAFIKIDAITVVNDPSDSWSTQDGFFTNLIDAAEIVIYQEGDTAEAVLGVFQLPCRVPVLREGTLKRVRIYPVIKQNGIASSRIYYPYYRVIELKDIALTPDATIDLDTLTTRYYPRTAMKVPWQEYFEPGQNSIKLDTCVSRITYDADVVCNGHGCGVIHVGKNQTELSFWTHDTIPVLNSTAYVYLEMDYWTDFDFSVGFKNPMMQGGAAQTYSAMTLYKNSDKGWQKIYINLGKLWEQYNYYPYLRLYFTILNPEKREGRVLLDNMKVVVM